MKKTTFLISALCMLILANVLMMSYASPAFRPTAEGFAASMNNEPFRARKPPRCKKNPPCKKCDNCKNKLKYMALATAWNECAKNPTRAECKDVLQKVKTTGDNPKKQQEYMKTFQETQVINTFPIEFVNKNEYFSNYSPAAAKDSYEPMGAFDNIKLTTGNTSSWRATSPDEPLQGNYPKFEVGPDNLFMFKDNQCKPSCCGASYACDGGCVCTTPEQRNFINMRGGNRTAPDAGV
jgi:hypothetical protein